LQAICLALILALTGVAAHGQTNDESDAPTPAEQHTKVPKLTNSFFTRTEIALISADTLARSIDAFTTNRIINNPCGCWHEANVPFATGTKAGSWAYSEGIVALNVGASYALHRLQHDRLAELVLAVDVAYDGTLDAGRAVYDWGNGFWDILRINIGWRSSIECASRLDRGTC
jgi:hypothetical protein